jgi:hypothetical protein
MSSMHCASCGSCSTILIPGTEVETALNSPPGLGSKVCCWLGPPSIHSRMQLLPRGRRIEAAWASDSNHGTPAAERTPAAASLRKSRRGSERFGVIMAFLFIE